MFEVAPKGFGFLRRMEKDFEQARDDVFVSPDLVRRYGLRLGVWIKGLAQQGPRGPQLVDITTVNDLPPDEARENADLARGEGLKHIRLIAPTTPADRVKLLAESAEGFIYALSRTGVTGAHGVPSEGIGEQVAKIKAHTATPVCVGFGITTADQALMVAKAADGVIVGSAIVKQIELHPGRAAEAVRDFATPLIAATKSA
jgi:tryptophan synthase alpha chain